MNPDMWGSRGYLEQSIEREQKSSKHEESITSELDLESCKYYVKEMLEGCIDFILSMDIEFKLILKIGTYNHLNDLDAKVNLLFSYLDFDHKGYIVPEDVQRAVKPHRKSWTLRDSSLVLRVANFYGEREDIIEDGE
jgi:hypothetical protein